MFKPSNFEKLLSTATSKKHLEPDWPTIMQICDEIRQRDVTVKDALNSIKKKMLDSNPHVADYALLVLESVVKNCGHQVHDEIATKPFMEQLKELIKNTQHEKVRAKALELVQAWAFAFRSNSKYHTVQELVNILKAEGYTFPVLNESDEMFASDSAPKWSDSSVCFRCRLTFSLLNRKHHCRACGNAICTECSPHFIILPEFGFEKKVRVCKACYESRNKSQSVSTKAKITNDNLSSENHLSSVQNQMSKCRKTAEEVKEEEELQLALALSQSEAEAKEKEKKRWTTEIMNNAAHTKKPTITMKEDDEEEDPELARYLNRSYWQKRQEEKNSEKKASSPDHFRSSPGGPPSAPTTPTHNLENGEISESELSEFVSCLKSQVEIFVNRMKSNSSRGRSISNDSSVQTLFMNVTFNHSKLLKYIHEQDDSRVYYEGLQDKLAQVKDAMMALDALRDEYREKLLREAEEAERQKQLQMAQKLEIMRRRKQEYLQYQRQLAIQKMQEQEREMQMRQEQQKQQYMMNSLGVAQGYPAWDPKISQMQSSAHQFGQQYQSLPAGAPSTSGYPIPVSSSNVSQQPLPPHLPGMVPQSVIQPSSMPTGPHSLPAQQPQRIPIQQQQPRLVNAQPSPRSMPNQPVTQIHPHILSNYQGIPLPGQNHPACVSSSPMLPQSQSLIIPSGGHINPRLVQGGAPNAVLPQGQQMKVNLQPNPSRGLPMAAGPGLPPGGALLPNVHRENERGLLPGAMINPPIPPQGINLPSSAQGIPQPVEQQCGPSSAITQVNPQNTPQAPPPFQQVPPNGEQNHSGTTGELISFD